MQGKDSECVEFMCYFQGVRLCTQSRVSLVLTDTNVYAETRKFCVVFIVEEFGVSLLP